MSSADLKFEIAINAIEVAVISIGLVGNLLTIIVFLRKTFRNNSISTYCISLAIVESFTLIQLIDDIRYLRYNVNLSNQIEVFCKLLYTNGMLLTSIPPWIMVAFSLDKLLSMRTRQIAILKKKWFQLSLVAAIVIFKIAFYIYIPILIRLGEIFPSYFICDLSTISFFKVHMILAILETYTIPFIIMMASSILTIWKLFKSRHSVKRIGKLATERKSRDHKYAISSIVLNAIFIVLKTPATIFFSLSAFYSYYNENFYSISLFFLYLNMSLGFFVHFMTNSLFRREFWSLFRFSRKNSGKIAPIVRINQVSTS